MYIEETSYDGLTYHSFINNGLWTHSVVNGRNVWTLNGNLKVNEIVVLTVRFNTTAVGNFTNTATAGSSETERIIGENITTVYNSTVPGHEEEPTKNPDISIEKIVLNDVVILGSQARFEIIVRNTGNVALTNVVVKEASYDGLIYDSFVDYTGLWSKNDDMTWKLNAPLRVGDYSGFFVVFNTTSAGEFTNVIVADSSEIPNKTANDTVEVLTPDILVKKITINRTVYVGEQVIFEIVVQNTGKVMLNNVVVSEDSFDGLTYNSFIDYTNLWTKNDDLSWTLNTPLYAGEYLSFYVVFDTDKAANVTNVISVSSDKTDIKNAENTTEVINNEDPGNKTSESDLDIVKVVYSVDGDRIVWAISVINNGPDKASNVRVYDVLPETLKFVSSAVSAGSYDANTGIWTIGDMENGDEAVMFIETIALGFGEFTNEANVTSDTPDPNPKNNNGNATVVIEKVPDKNETVPDEAPVEPQKEANVLPATGNPLIMVLLVLIALGGVALRRKK